MATFTVTATTDDANDTGSLRYAVNNAQDGDVIEFADSLGASTITIGQPLAVSQGITIDGGSDITVSQDPNQGTQQGRFAGIFDIQGGAAPITIRNLTLANGNAKGASGTSGQAAGDPGGPGGNAAGGIYVRSGTLTLTDINFTDTRAEGGSGGQGGSNGDFNNPNKGAGGTGGNAAGGVYVEPGATVTAARLTYQNVTGTPGSGGFGNPEGADGTAYTFSNSQAVNEGVACYVTGTLIRTVRGDVAVEDLAIGDRVVTASGVHRPIKWIGTRSYAGRFIRNSPELLPIRFAAGSLANGVPARDLCVSPKHAMVLDGCLIPAEHLVNGTTITRVERIETLTYWHIELDSHDVLIAEGAESESFVDDDSRGMFHNAHTFAALYPAELRREARYCLPRVEGGFALQAVRRRLALRAGLPVAAEREFGTLRGRVDGCDGVRVWGWAQSEAYPDAPVCLEVLVDGAAVGLVYAELYRADLPKAGIGDGCHAFTLTLPVPLAPGAAVVVRRAADGIALKGVTQATAPLRDAA